MELQEITPALGRSLSRSKARAQKLDLISDDTGIRPLLTSSDDASAAAKPNSAKRASLLSDLRWWLPELCATALSVCSLNALIILVRMFQGRGLNELHLPASITLNGLVAILSTMNRAALMIPVGSVMSQEVWLWLSNDSKKYPCRCGRLKDLEISDRASRGAWGSIILLLKLERRWLASYCALITIVSLGFGTFTQQLLTFRLFPVEREVLQPGSIQRSETYQSPEVSLAMVAAVYNGMLTNNTQRILAPCPTGNCTWPQTPTLAVCGNCTMSEYQTQCFPGSQNATTTILPYCEYTLVAGPPTVRLYDFSMPNPNYDGFSMFEVLQQDSFYNLDPTSSRLSISEFIVFGAPFNAELGPNGSVVWPNSSTVSSQCALWMCVQTLNTSTLNTDQSQFLVHNTSDSFVWDNSSGFFLLNSTLSSPEATYNVSKGSLDKLSEYLFEMINGTITLLSDSDSAEPSASSDVIEAIWGASGDLDGRIRNLALSMTNLVRTDSPAQDDIYNGIAYHLGYQVRWQWIILPITLVISSASILAVAIVQTNRSSVSAWKGSPLTLLLMNVDENIRSRAAGSMDTYDGLRRSVGMKKVVIRTEADGGRILKQA